METAKSMKKFAANSEDRSEFVAPKTWTTKEGTITLLR
jgi:hypothetical protein